MSGESQSPPPSVQITPALHLWYGVGQLAEGVKVDAFAIFVLFYYREVLKLPGTLTGLALMIALSVDAITDPLVGSLSDRTRTRWGRRHPYMVASIVPVTVSYYLVFVPPQGLSELALFAWLTSFIVLTRVAITLFVVPHMALGAELADDYDERTRLVTTRMTFSTFGRALAGGLGFLVFMRPTETFEHGQLNPAAYPPYALTTAMLIGAPILVSCVKTRHVIAPLRARLGRQVPDAGLTGVFRDFLNCLRVRNFRVHFAGSTVAYAAWGLAGTLALHLATYFWRVSTEVLTLWGVGMFFGMFTGLAVWSRLAETREKVDVFIRGLSVYVLCTCAPMLLRARSVWPDDDSIAHLVLYVGVTGFLANFGIASTMVTGGSMMADITDEDELLHGQRREGVFFGAVAFAAKGAVGLGAQIAGVVVDLVGLVPGSDPATVSQDVSQRLGFAVGVTVTAVVGLSMWIYLRYDLSRARLNEVRAQLSHAK